MRINLNRKKNYWCWRQWISKKYRLFCIQDRKRLLRHRNKDSLVFVDENINKCFVCKTSIRWFMRRRIENRSDVRTGSLIFAGENGRAFLYAEQDRVMNSQGIFSYATANRPDIWTNSYHTVIGIEGIPL